MAFDWLGCTRFEIGDFQGLILRHQLMAMHLMAVVFDLPASQIQASGGSGEFQELSSKKDRQLTKNRI
jgi:hypothetical protein